MAAKPESYLITGGCGLQGASIVEALLAKQPGAAIAVLTRNPTVNLFPGVTYHRGDLTVADDVAQAFSAAKPTVVFHCAGIINLGHPDIPDAAVRAVNDGGTSVLVEAARRFGVKALVYTSSASVVQVDTWRDIKDGNESMKMCTYEDDAKIYPQAKAEGERTVLAADTPGGMRTTSLRPAAIYGERDNELIPKMIANMRAGNNKLQFGDNTNLFSFTYVGNSTDAHLIAADKLLHAPDGVAGEAFFITNGTTVPFWDFGRAVFAAAGQPVTPQEVRVLSRRTALLMALLLEWVFWLQGKESPLNRDMVNYTCMNRYYDISKARERLGWEPKVEWQEGVKRGVEWFLTNEREKEGK